jgi:hypothetical protein
LLDVDFPVLCSCSGSVCVYGFSELVPTVDRLCGWFFLASDILILVDKLWIEGLLFVVDRMVFGWDSLFCVVWLLVIRSCILEKPYVDLFGYPCLYRRIFLRSEYVTPVLMMADYWWILVVLDYVFDDPARYIGYGCWFIIFFPVLGMLAVRVLSCALNWVSIMGFDSCLDDLWNEEFGCLILDLYFVVYRDWLNELEEFL